MNALRRGHWTMGSYRLGPTAHPRRRLCVLGSDDNSRSSNSLTAIFFCCCAIVLSASRIASGDFVSLTDVGSPGGAGNVTRDLATGLEWLDWTVSTGATYEEIVSQIADEQPFNGWRHATLSEVETLFEHAGLVTHNWPFRSGDADEGEAGNALMGFLGATASHQTSAMAFNGESPVLPLSIVTVGTDPVFGLVSLVSADGLFGETEHHPQIGHALVRNAVAVPEPVPFRCLTVVSVIAVGIRRWCKLRSLK